MVFPSVLCRHSRYSCKLFDLVATLPTRATKSRLTVLQTRLHSSRDGDKDGAINLYLHVGPSGDFWTGHNIFAAKHLQPDYVKSVKLDPNLRVDRLLELLEDNDDWAQEIYDAEALPQFLVQELEGLTKNID